MTSYPAGRRGRLNSHIKLRLPGILGLSFLALIGMTACNRNEHAPSAAQPLMMSKEQRAAESHGTLSREHTATITVAEADLAERFRRGSTGRGFFVWFGSGSGGFWGARTRAGA